MRHTRLAPFTLGLLALLIAAPEASAASRQAKERAAKKACLKGDFAKGMDLLTDLYVDTNDATYIYNQGRCFEQNNRFDDAITRFREYLRKARDASQADRDDAERHIADCVKLGKKETDTPKIESAATPMPATSPADDKPAGGGLTKQAGDASAGVPASSLPATTAAEVSVHAQSPGDAATSGSGLRVVGVVMAGFGAAAVIAGVALNVEHNSTVKDLRAHYNPATDSSNQTTKTLAWVGYGVGAACLATGAVLYYLGWSKKRAAMVPAAVAGRPGMAIGGAF